MRVLNAARRRQCFLPGKDVLLPIFKSRTFVQSSPFLTGVHRERKILFSFLGNALRQPPRFSIGLRQQARSRNRRPKLHQCTHRSSRWSGSRGRGDWTDRESAVASGVGRPRGTIRFVYSSALPAAQRRLRRGGDSTEGARRLRSHRRPHAQLHQRAAAVGLLRGGAGQRVGSHRGAITYRYIPLHTVTYHRWAHIEEPVIQGCIPVVIMPGIHVQLEGVLDLSRFGVRVARDDIPKLVDILRAIPQAKVERMQAEVLSSAGSESTTSPEPARSPPTRC